MKNTAFLPNSLDGPDLDLIVEPKKSRVEQDRDEAREVARELLQRLLLFAGRETRLSGEWERKYPWLKVGKWPDERHPQDP